MTHFGDTKNGDAVAAVTLSAHGLTVTILTYGARVQDVRLDGIPHSLTVGSDTLADYEGAMRYHGPIVGPVANRISNGSAVIAGQTYLFDRNQDNKHTLHGGTNGSHSKIWKIDNKSQNSLTLSLQLPNRGDGMPGNRHITARFDIRSGPTLRLTIMSRTDAPTLMNLTNHSYWTLDGHGDLNDHTLQIAAETYLPTDDQAIATGEIAPVSQTGFDFRTPEPLPKGTPPIDNTFCVAPQARDLTDVMWLRAKSGLTLTVATTEPGLHIFDNRPDYGSIAVEAQGWPDAPNKPDFPSIALTPDTPKIQTTEWRFSKT